MSGPSQGPPAAQSPGESRGNQGVSAGCWQTFLWLGDMVHPGAMCTPG